MSGLRDELAALVASPDDTQEWENEGWRGVRQVQVIDAARLAALLDRFPPEAEGEAGRRMKSARKELKKKANEWDERSEFWERQDRASGLHVMARQGAAAFREVRAALAASPEEQDR